MAQRVLATQEAVQAIQKMQQIIAGGLTDQVKQLDAQGRTLSDSNVWDGPKANEFRSQLWPQVNSTLQKTVTELTELRTKLDAIQRDILAAGGQR
jgi:hypothetical protein